MSYGLTLVTPAVGEPVDLGLLKQHLRVNIPDEDRLIAHYLTSARQMFESHADIQLLPATWKMSLDTWPLPYWNQQLQAMLQMQGDYWPYYTVQSQVIVPKHPLVAVTSVQYVDTTGATQTLTTDHYQYDPTRLGGRVLFVNLPALHVYLRPAVTITYTAGYVNAAAIPAVFKTAIMLQAASWYLNRESLVEKPLSMMPLGWQTIVAQARTWQVGDSVSGNGNSGVYYAGR